MLFFTVIQQWCTNNPKTCRKLCKAFHQNFLFLFEPGAMWLKDIKNFKFTFHTSQYGLHPHTYITFTHIFARLFSTFAGFLYYMLNNITQNIYVHSGGRVKGGQKSLHTLSMNASSSFRSIFVGKKIFNFPVLFSTHTIRMSPLFWDWISHMNYGDDCNMYVYDIFFALHNENGRRY